MGSKHPISDTNGSNVPAIIYNNANTDKSQILKDNNGRAGIYQWRHIKSGQIYIGSAVDLSKRFKNYYNKAYVICYKTSYINNALFSHGYSSFSLTILEYLDITNLSLEETRKFILEREQSYLDSLEPEPQGARSPFFLMFLILKTGVPPGD